MEYTKGKNTKIKTTYTLYTRGNYDKANDWDEEGTYMTLAEAKKAEDKYIKDKINFMSTFFGF